MDIGAFFNQVIVQPMTLALEALNGGFVALGLHFELLSSWALTIILFTFLIKVVTLPLTLKQLRSAKATARLQPELQAIQKQYGKNREAAMKAQQALYKENGANPLAGCLPTLIQMPIWIGLYNALFNLAQQASFAENSRFFWIPNLATLEVPGGMEAIFAIPPAIPVLAILTGVTGWFTQKIMTPPSVDPNQKQMQTMMQFMPVMFVFFSISVPSGLVLYWVANNVFTMLQQWALERWGGLNKFNPVVVPTLPESTDRRPTPTPRNRATAAALRGDAKGRTDEAEAVGEALPQAAPGARKRRRRSR